MSAAGQVIDVPVGSGGRVHEGVGGADGAAAYSGGGRGDRRAAAHRREGGRGSDEVIDVEAWAT